MVSNLWPCRSLPEVEGTAWEWQVSSLAQLPAVRAQLRALLCLAGGDGAGKDPVCDRLVLAVDELASNALRHGGPPVTTRVVATGQGWLVDVSDRAPEHGPQPAVGRDRALGGMGLYLVAELTAGHGWTVADGRKHVWACLPAA